MKWQGRRESDNVEDRRGGGNRLMFGGIGGLVIAAIIYLLGGDPSRFLSNDQSAAPVTEQSPADDTMSHFVKVVLADTEDVWEKLFADMSRKYEKPVMVLFTGHTQSGCGFASAATGPFYCPADQRVYIDLSFYRELQNRFHAPGDFAMAYVVAHEVGHHIQYLLGTSQKVSRLQSGRSEKEANRLSVMLELQADFYAGVWAHHAQKMKNILENGDIDAALRAATAIGDDRLQQEAQGYVVPDAFTHGTSAQRVYWFKKGYETGDITQGNTFEAPDLR